MQQYLLTSNTSWLTPSTASSSKDPARQLILTVADLVMVELDEGGQMDII